MEKFLANVEHIISIDAHKQKPTHYFQWVPERVETIRQGLFRKKVNVTIPGHYASYYDDDNTKYKTVSDAIATYGSGHERFGTIDDPSDKGPDKKSAVLRPYLHLTLSGGKYTGSHTIYYNTNEELYADIKRIEEAHPNKFVIFTH